MVKITWFTGYYKNGQHYCSHILVAELNLADQISGWLNDNGFASEVRNINEVHFIDQPPLNEAIAKLSSCLRAVFAED